MAAPNIHVVISIWKYSWEIENRGCHGNKSEKNEKYLRFFLSYDTG